MNNLIAINAIDLQNERPTIAFYHDLLEYLKFQFTEYQILSEYDDE